MNTMDTLFVGLKGHVIAFSKRYGTHLVAGTKVTQALGTWGVLSSGTFGLTPVTYTDTGAAGQPQRYYRVLSP
jgi:hypothetical protein